MGPWPISIWGYSRSQYGLDSVPLGPRSAFGAKRTWIGWQDRFDRSRLTHLRHRHDRNPAAQRSPVWYSFHSKAREALGNETARFHHAHRHARCSGGARTATKKFAMYGTFETVTR
jgi:hypothetical protein